MTSVARRSQVPDDLSPLLAGFVYHRGFGQSFRGVDALAITLTSLAAKGLVTVTENHDHHYTIQTNNLPAQDLPLGERVLMESLFTEQIREVTISEAFDPHIEQAMNAVKNAVEEEYGRTHLRQNRALWYAGAGLASLVIIVTLLPDAPTMSADAPLFTAAAYTLPAVIGLYGVMHRGVVPASISTIARVVVFAWLLFVLNAMLLDLASVTFTRPGTFDWGVSVAAILLTIAFRHWLTAPTRIGGRVLAIVEGYRQYLVMPETDRQKLSGQTSDGAQDNHSRHWAYALALDAEETWQYRFKLRLSFASSKAPQAARRYPIGWFRERGFGTRPGVSEQQAPKPEASDDHGSDH